MPAKWATCRCGAYLPVDDAIVFPEHNYGDAPAWWKEARCEMSGKPIKRRPARSAGKWWERYVKPR